MSAHHLDSTSTHQLEGMSTHWSDSTSTQQFSSTISTIIHQLAMDIHQFNSMSTHRLMSIHSFHARIAYHGLAVVHHRLAMITHPLHTMIARHFTRTWRLS
jgi:hypothetical protein